MSSSLLQRYGGMEQKVRPTAEHQLTRKSCLLLTTAVPTGLRTEPSMQQVLNKRLLHQNYPNKSMAPVSTKTRSAATWPLKSEAGGWSPLDRMQPAATPVWTTACFGVFLMCNLWPIFKNQKLLQQKLHFWLLVKNLVWQPEARTSPGTRTVGGARSSCPVWARQSPVQGPAHPSVFVTHPSSRLGNTVCVLRSRGCFRLVAGWPGAGGS